MSQVSVPWKRSGPPQFRGGERVIAGLAKSIYRVGEGLFQRFPYLPLFLLIAAVVGGIIATWLHYVLFAWVTQIAISPANTPEVSAFGLPLTVAEIQQGLADANRPNFFPIQYLLWPLQSEFVRDLACLGGVFTLFNLIPAFAIWWERKVAGRIQSRMGPMRVGGWHGWAQSVADGIKLVAKEDFIPDEADKPLFRLAPYLTLVPSLLAFLCLPLGTYWVFRNVDVALVFILAMLGVEVVGVIMAGWASNNKWSVYGAMREACQMVSYEIPMTTVLLIPVMSAGTLSLVEISNQQGGSWFDWFAFSNPFMFIAFITYYIASLASCKRAPFDLPESESELVAGFLTEYSGFRWSLFFFAEYAAMFVVSGLCVMLFLGGWHSGLPKSWLEQSALLTALFTGPHIFVIKSFLFIYLQMWIRWTLPRIRIDQVLYSCVQVMFPISLVALVGHTLWELIPEGNTFAWIVNILLGLVGLAVLAVCFSIIAYGATNRRRLVGYLAVDQLPGS